MFQFEKAPTSVGTAIVKEPYVKKHIIGIAIGAPVSELYDVFKIPLS